MSNIFIRRIFYPVTVLGPGTRLGIWLQGCSVRCKGCMSPDMWEYNTVYSMSDEKLAAILTHYSHQGIQSVTLSGGEPFDQEDALFYLLESLRERGFDDILVYSGYDLNQIREKWSKHLCLIDILISGPFLYDRPTSSKWYGSSNQQISVLSKEHRFDAEYLDLLSKSIEPSIQIETDGKEVFLIGILQKRDYQSSCNDEDIMREGY